jgi:hypothetical protein
LLNVLLLATLLFGEWLSLETRLAGVGVLVAIWLLARWQSRGERRANAAQSTTAADGSIAAADGEEPDESGVTERDQWFREAQGHYLRNDWVATEQGLLKLLKRDARDVESRLMLATLWRHQGRCPEAQRQLDRLERLEAASDWQCEIAAERMAIREASGRNASDERTDAQQAENQSGAPPEQPEPTDTKNNDHREDESGDHPGSERRAA